MSARGISQQLGERTCFNVTSGAEPSLVATVHLSVLERCPFPGRHGASASVGASRGPVWKFHVHLPDGQPLLLVQHV